MRAQFFTGSFFTISCPLVDIKIDSSTQIHTLSAYLFTFWIHALKLEEKQPTCALVISR
jgi:hypothetical protein